jgi:cell division septal protein FtsQ
MRKVKRFKKRKLFVKSPILWIGIGVVVLIISLLYILFFSPFVQITKITVVGNETVLAQDIEQGVLGIAQNKVFLFSTQSIVLFSEKKAQAYIQERFPELEQVEVKRKLFQEVLVHIQERQQVALWCSTECFALDMHGVVFKQAQEGLRFNAYQDNTVVAGEQVLAEQVVTDLVQFIQGVQSMVTIASLELVSQDRVEIVSNKGWRVYVAPKEDMQWQQEKLKTVLTKEISTQERESLEYIDVRFGDQAYVKYQGN